MLSPKIGCVENLLSLCTSTEDVIPPNTKGKVVLKIFFNSNDFGFFRIFSAVVFRENLSHLEKCIV